MIEGRRAKVCCKASESDGPMALIDSTMPYPLVRRHSDLNTLDYLLLFSAMEIYHNTVPLRAEGSWMDGFTGFTAFVRVCVYCTRVVVCRGNECMRRLRMQQCFNVPLIYYHLLWAVVSILE
jgi:hypothetical protein